MVVLGPGGSPGVARGGLSLNRDLRSRRRDRHHRGRMTPSPPGPHGNDGEHGRVGMGRGGGRRYAQQEVSASAGGPSYRPGRGHATRPEKHGDGPAARKNHGGGIAAAAELHDVPPRESPRGLPQGRAHGGFPLSLLDHTSTPAQQIRTPQKGIWSMRPGPFGPEVFLSRVPQSHRKPLLRIGIWLCPQAPRDVAVVAAIRLLVLQWPQPNDISSFLSLSPRDAPRGCFFALTPTSATVARKVRPGYSPKRLPPAGGNQGAAPPRCLPLPAASPNPDWQLLTADSEKAPWIPLTPLTSTRPPPG